MRSTDATWPAAGMLPVAEPLSSFTTSSAVAAKYATVEAARYFPSIPVRSASEQVLTATYAPVKGADDALTTVPVTKPSGDLACRKKYLPEDTMPRVADAGAPVKGLDVIREPACRASATSLSRWTPCTSKARATTTGRPASSPGTSGIESSADAASVLLLRSRSTALRNVKSAPTIPAAAAGSRLRTWTGAVRSSAPAGMVRMFPSLSRMRPPSAPMRTPDSATVGSDIATPTLPRRSSAIVYSFEGVTGKDAPTLPGFVELSSEFRLNPAPCPSAPAPVFVEHGSR